MRAVTIGLNIAAESIPYTVDIAELADRNGIEYMWVVDSQLRFRDPFIAMSAAATRTSKIRLGTSVTNPLTRHYTVLAGSIATLDELSNSRAVLGIGAGHSAVFNIGKKPVSLTNLKRSIELIRTLLQGGLAEDTGMKMKLFTQRNVPIYIGASGPKTLALAGEVADGAFLQVGARPGIFHYAVNATRQAAEKAGRELKAIDLAGYVVCSISSDKDKGIKAVKFMVSSILGFAGTNILSLPEDITGLSREQLKRIREIVDPKTLTTKGEVPNDIVDKLTVVGGPSYCIERLSELAKSGVTQICLNLQPPEERLNQTRLLIQDILPSL